METKEYIRIELDNLKKGVGRAIRELSQKEIEWRPAYGCNSIGLILYHCVRFEDGFISNVRNAKEVWETEKWYQKLNLPITDIGAQYNVDQVNTFQVPALKDILAYWEAVRSNTLKYLDGFTPNQFDQKVTLRYFGEVPTAMVFALVINHIAEHTGEISYLRGLQRGMNK